MSKVLVAIPYWDTIEPIVAAAATRIALSAGGMLPLFVKGRPIDYARNSIVRLFLQHKNLTHLLTLDSDVEPPVDALQRLLDCNTDLASGCYRLHMPSGLKWAAHECRDGKYYLLDKLPDDKNPFWADAGGAGCLLIRRSVLENMQWPWFKWTEYENGTQQSEDVYFFKKANAAGLRVRFDPQVICRHYKTIPI
jgi:hypothetical protein